ncbi:MAG: hypothetical protein JXR46_01490 [Calditrichaceae bacterium]|nr:hypothetical protein [Calditrichaceae bacterium]MBN2707691.1 hypothetical protein [Calditrichaceae bacterium]RQV96495.1 MAG: hypothetical protein EH224_04560 [Calditrichota bacterium]
MKKFFIILGIVVLVVIIAGGIYIYINKDNLATMAIDQAFKGIEQVTIQNLPENYDAQEVKDLISKAKNNLAEKGFDNPDLQSLMVNFKDAYEDQKLDSLEIETLMNNLKTIAE